MSNVHKFPFLEFSPFSGEAAPLLPPELVRKGYDTISGGAGENEMCDFANYLAQFFARYFASWKEFNQEVVEILVLLTRLLFSCDIVRRLPRRVSQAKQTSAAWRC